MRVNACNVCICMSAIIYQSTLTRPIASYQYFTLPLMLNLGGDPYQEGLAGYRLGNGYRSVGDHDTAIQVGTRNVATDRFAVTHQSLGSVSIRLSARYYIQRRSRMSMSYHLHLLQCYKSYLEHCKYHRENKGIGSAYEALAKAYERYNIIHTCNNKGAGWSW